MYSPSQYAEKIDDTDTRASTACFSKHCSNFLNGGSRAKPGLGSAMTGQCQVGLDWVVLGRVRWG